MVAGVAGGLAQRLGVEAVFVRIAAVVLAAAGGAGLVAYVALWALAPEPRDDEPLPTRSAHDAGWRALGLGCVVAGLLLGLRQLGVWFGDALVWPLALAGAGSAVIWARSDGGERTRLSRLAARLPGAPVGADRASLARVTGGVLLVLSGMFAFLAAHDALAIVALRDVVLAGAVTAAGVGLIVGPWVWRLGRQLAEERRERGRADERAEVAAHLHDSVLQTLALIQRAEDPRRMSALARAQERELRAWLSGTIPSPDSLRAAVEQCAAAVEDRHGITVETVVVGDAQADERVQALVAATGEALTNAAIHAGVDHVSLFVEVEHERLTVAVTDHGRGFDPATVPDDRRGLSESIRGRMARHGGTCELHTQPGEGTELTLTLPRTTTPATSDPATTPAPGGTP